MKKYTQLFILSLAVLSAFTITACSKEEAIGTTTSDTGTMSESSDIDVTTKVKTALLSDQNSKDFDIAVVTLNGDVRLTGVVDNQGQLDQIDKLVRSIEGVHTIHDELTIRK